MQLKKIGFILLFIGFFQITPGQEAQKNLYKDSTGQLFVKANAPIYFFISPQGNENDRIILPSTDKLANPMYFDGPGRHYLVYNNKDEKVRYLIYADAKGPKPKVKVQKGLLLGHDKRFYVDLNSEFTVDARDDYSGTAAIYYSVNGLPFKHYTGPINFSQEGESELKVYATDNVGNTGDTSTYKIITSPNAVFKINNIYFETASAKLLPESYDNLQEMLQILKDFPELIVEISAYADSRGSSESNQRLSERRAQSVVNYLNAKGIDAGRLKSKGYGDTKIINECVKGVTCPDSRHRENRRVEFKFSLPK